MSLKTFIAFSGIGSQEESMKNLKWDFEVVANSEFNERVEEAYHLIHNIPKEKNKGDITKIKIENLNCFTLFQLQIVLKSIF